jgi:hypothetical protein
MAQFGSDERPFLDTLTLPSILVMPGDPWPSDFYSRYPGAIRLPVRIVWREGPSGPSALPVPQTRPATPSPARGSTSDRPGAEYAVGEAGGSGVAAAFPIAPSAHGRVDPVGTFLRTNDALDRVAGKPAFVPGTPPVGPDGKPQDPNTPVPFFDDQRTPVHDPDGNQMMRPAAFDPHLFVSQGLKGRAEDTRIDGHGQRS